MLLAPVRDERRDVLDFRWLEAMPTSTLALGCAGRYLVGRSLDDGHLPICLPRAVFTSRVRGGQRWNGTAPDFTITLGIEHQGHQPSGSRARLVGAACTQSARIEGSIPTLGWISLHQHAVVTEQVETSWKASASVLPVSDLGTHSSDDPRRSVNRNAWRRIASRRRRLTVH